MKLSTLFIPETVSDKKLEEMLKKEQPKKEYKLSNKKYDYFCDVCGRFAGSIEIVTHCKNIDKTKKLANTSYWPDFEFWPDPDIPSYKKPELITRSFIGTTTMPRDEDFLKSIIEDLENNNIKSVLNKLKGDCLAFYCPTCDKCYCKDHWSTRIVWEDWGWYDYTMGACPKGHERMIDD